MFRKWVLLTASSMSALLSAQNPSAGSDFRFYSGGTIANGVYTNECLGFSLSIPSGWEIRVYGGSLGDYWRDRNLPGPGEHLLVLDRNPTSSLPSRIALTEPTPHPEPPSAKDYVNTFVQIEMKVPGRELIHDAVAVQYGGQTFYRSDYKQTYRDGKVLYFAFVYTQFRKRMLGESITAASQAELDESADSLQHISFQEDQVDPKCVDGAIISSIGGFSIPSPASVLPDPKLAKVSEAIGQSMLVKRVDPEYPELARKVRIQGKVIVLATISENGDVEKIELISGHPVLAPAAIAAAKQWKYKPFLRDGKPVKMQTQATVEFELPM